MRVFFSKSLREQRSAIGACTEIQSVLRQTLRRHSTTITELREGRQFAVLRQVQPQRARHLPHGLDLRVAADAAHRESHVDRRADAAVEQIASR